MKKLTRNQKMLLIRISIVLIAASAIYLNHEFSNKPQNYMNLSSIGNSINDLEKTITPKFTIGVLIKKYLNTSHTFIETFTSKNGSTKEQKNTEAGKNFTNMSQNNGHVKLPIETQNLLIIIAIIMVIITIVTMTLNLYYRLLPKKDTQTDYNLLVCS